MNKLLSFRSRIRHYVLVIAAIGMSFSAAFAQSPTSTPDIEYRSYLAHIAAASNALRVNDTADAKRWLAGTPKKYRGWEWNYLNAEVTQNAGGFSTHDQSVNAVAVSPDGKFIASSSTDRSVKVTDAKTGREIFKFSDPNLAPQSLAFSSNRRYIAAAFSRHTVIVWNLETKSEARRLQGQGRGITAVAFSPDMKLIASCSWNFSQERGVWGIVEIWNTETGEAVKQLEYGTKPLVAISFSPNGKHLAVASWEVDKIAAMWDTSKWGDPDVLETEGDDVYKAGQTIAFSPDSKLLAAGGKDNAVRIWDVDSKKLIRKIGGSGSGHTKWINGVAFTPDGRSLVSASTDQTVRVWEVATGNENALFRGHTKSVNAVAVSPDGEQIFTGSGDASIKTWDFPKGNTNVWKHDGNVYGFGFSPDGKYAVSAAWLGKLRIWNVDSGLEEKEWAAHRQSANAAMFSPDGSRIVSVGNDGMIKLWDAASGRELRTFEEVKGPQLIAAVFTPDSKHILAASSSDRAKLWSVETGQEIRNFAHEKGVNFVAISKNGNLIATGGADGSIILWNAATGKKLAAVSAGTGRVLALAFSPDSRSIAAASGRTVRIYNTRTLDPIFTLDGHDEGIFGISYSPDGKLLVSASADQTVKLWDTATGEPVLTLPFAETAYGAFFSPDGEKLVVLPQNNTVRVLDSEPHR